LALELAEKEKKLLLAAQKIDVDAAEALRKANLKSQKIIDETIARSQKLYEEFKKQAEEEKQTEKAWQQSRKKLKNWQEELEEQLPKRIYTGQAPKSLVEGDLVFIPRINQKATVLASADSNGDVALQVGVLKLMMKLEELRLADDIPEGKDEPKSKRSDFRMEKAAKIQNEIHLRGMEVSEAL
ncbi:MAG: MutS2/Smr-associated SH3 domain-containing protein, partial [Clostridiales bacterium]